MSGDKENPQGSASADAPEGEDMARHAAWDAVALEAPRAEVRARALAAAILALPPARPTSASDAMRAREERVGAKGAEGAEGAEGVEGEGAEDAAPDADDRVTGDATKKLPSFPPPSASLRAAAKAARRATAMRALRPDDHDEDGDEEAAGSSPSSPPASVTGPRTLKRFAKERRTQRLVGAATFAVLALAATFMVTIGRDGAQHKAQGDVVARDRTEVSVGSRARVVLEPNAHVAWQSTEEVTQSEGSAFYRVEPGTTFKVHTPVGDVTVLGTCFRIKVRAGDASANANANANAKASSNADANPNGDASLGGGTMMTKRDVKSGVVGAVSTAIAFVAVYEGKVAVSHAGQSVQLVAGEAADLGPGAPKKDEDGSAAERAFDDRAFEEDEAKGDPTLRANKNLVASVADYRARLERLDVQKRALEQELAETKDKLGLAAGDAGAFVKNEVNEEEWKELAKNGTIKMRVPCNWKGGWWPPPAKLNELGLSRDDGTTIQAASNRLYESSWAKIRPVCEKIGGKDLAEKLGLDGCPSFVFNYMKGADKDNALEAMRRVSEMRAGLRPLLSVDDPQLGPVEKVMLVLTGEQQAFEADLAQSFGPDEAHRIVTSDSLCSWSSTWNGPGPRKPATP